MSKRFEVENAGRDELLQDIERSVSGSVSKSLGKHTEAIRDMEEKLYVFKTWLTVKEAAKYLGVCRRTIDNYIDDGLPYAQPRKIRYINREDLDAWVEEHRVQDDLNDGS